MFDNKYTKLLAFEKKNMQSCVWLFDEAIDRLAELAKRNPEQSLEIGAIRELIRDGRGPIACEL